MRTLFEYWCRQLTFISADETLRRVMDCLWKKKPGTYLRFGRGDIDAALGFRKSTAEIPDALILETRAAFQLSGENIYKALHVECSALGLPFRARSIGVTNREAIDRLNAVGPCFLDWPIYSYTAIIERHLDPPDILEQFFESLKACRPVLIFKQGDASEAALEKILPSALIAVPVQDIYKSVDSLEERIWTSVSQANDFPVIVLALGVVGRILIKRLLKRGFPGFLLDLDNLQKIDFQAKPSVRKFWPMRQLRVTHVEKPLPDLNSAGKLHIRWEGPFLGHYSFSVINRELCSWLCQDDRIQLSIRPSDTPFSIDSNKPLNSREFRSLITQVGKPLPRPAQIHIRNHVQHSFRPPLEGRWVIIQPWDYMSLPIRWVAWIRNQIDEVWVPSDFVRNAFLEGGIPAERVAVVPNGVDVRLYRPNARKVKLETRKSFKFLFVGGSFWRKGFDILMEAYGKAFTARDDVSLIIKSVPEFWSRAGSQQLTEFRSQAGAPEVIDIVQSLDQERMAGLYASCNCLVHPYRAEGFAICVAEGMASGLPVIVTGTGGTKDFCNSQTAFLISARLRQMSEKKLDNEPTLDYPAYAEPELDSLVQWMRYVYEHSRETRVIAQAGMNKIRTEFTWEHAAGIAIQRLLALENKPIQRFMEG